MKIEIGNVSAIMEERGITKEDIDAVIAWAEGEGGKLADPERDRCLGKKRLENVTVYVEYSIADGDITAYNVYSHRVTLREND